MTAATKDDGALAPARLFSLAGKVVLLTGAAGGIGGGLARGFAAAGARLVLADRRDRKSVV